MAQALSSVQREPQLLGIVASLAKQVSENKLTAETALRKASEISPDAAITLKDWMQFAPSLLMVLLTVVQIYLSYMQGRDSISEKEMKQYVEQAISEALGQNSPLEENVLITNSSKKVSKIGNAHTQEQPYTENRKARRAQKAKSRNQPRGQR
ncbi:hypothetical protein [Paracoccus sp. SY]|uniref:hypothetical protein n=1 Tax=Paracoccus sp. SY TaxID=1330255 RepID=UPI0011AFC95A|nr:hypothetical protein [Paracoccus sp. SY]